MRYRFGEFELDTDAFELRRADELIPLEPQVFGVLACLVERHERLVSRDELLDEVWGHRFVTDATVASRVKAARRAIGDDGLAQRLIRTVTGRGYRFVGTVEAADRARAKHETRATPVAKPAGPRVELVGRDDELAALDEHLRAADGGGARVVLVTGEAGSGKTTLVEAFRAGLGGDRRVWIGHCLPISSGAEPYWPVLDALATAAKADDTVAERLVREAPTWVAQLPLRLPAELSNAGAPASGPVTQGRIVREFLAAVEALSEEDPILLVLEDLHWADEATLGLVEALARRGSPARLLVVATVRPAEARGARGGTDALVHELTVRGVAHEVPLAPLSPEAIDAYVRGRVGADAPAWLSELLAERTGGNALFLGCLVDSWLADGRIRAGDGASVPAPGDLAHDVPANVRRLIASQLDELDDDVRLLLEAASVGGVRFTAAAVAAACDGSLRDVDDALATMAAAGRLIRSAGEAAWPDGTRCGRYSFVHELYRDGVYGRLSRSRRAEMHAAVGRRLEQAYGEAAPQHFAARLAHHFVEAGDARRAVRYLRAAAEQSLARSAHAEAAQQAGQAIELLGPDWDAREAAELEIALRSTWAAAQIALRGWAAPEIEDAYERSRLLCETSGDEEALASALYALAILHEYRGEYERSDAILSQHLERGVDALVPEALELLACSTFHQGQFERSVELAERALAGYDASLASEYLARLGESPAVRYHCWAALALWFLGREEESLAHLGAALAEAQAHAYSQTTAQAQAAFLHQYRRDAAEARRWAETTIAISTEHGFPFRVAQATILRGWALAAQGDFDEGSEELERGLDLYRATGAGMDLPYYLGLAAEVAARRGRRDEARSLVDQACSLLPERGFFYEAPLRRLDALLRADDDPDGALAALEDARSVAQAQRAPRLEAEIEALLRRARGGEALGIRDLEPPGAVTTKTSGS